jgi:dipeptidase D
MLRKIVEYFLEICTIPHCSKDADRLFEFLVDFAKSKGYAVQTDSAKNILISKGSPKLCLQAHYDMVCVGKAPDIHPFLREDNFLIAKESSLGADNGIAIAMMMVLMEEGKELEFLITSDEEIGLIGASALEFDLSSSYMLNLDSEDEGEVYIGCAGGADIKAVYSDELVDGVGKCYEVAVLKLQGGHSGVDIDKNIPSAIKVLASYLASHKLDVVSMYAGERINSIPANAVAIVRSSQELNSSDKVQVRELTEEPKVLKNSDRFIKMLDGFVHGVIEFDEKLAIPYSSANLALVNSNEDGTFDIECSLRAMDMDELTSITDEYKLYFQNYGCTVEVTDKYPAWKPEVNEFTDIVFDKLKKHFKEPKLKAIHAGLECGVISQKYPHIKFASIGPTIRYPHSTREEVDIDSVRRTFEVLQDVIDSF